MKKLIIIVLVGLGVFTVALAATIFEDNFNSYTDGDLNGQGDWSGNAIFDVEGTLTYEGTKAVEWTSGLETSISKVGTAQTDGRIVFYVYPEQTDKRAFFDLKEGGDVVTYYAFSGDFNTAGHVYLYNSGGWQDVGAYNVDEWNICEVEWRSSDHKIRGRLNEGTWTDWLTSNHNWTGGIDTFTAETQNPNGNFTFDTIQEDLYTEPPPTSEGLDYSYVRAILLLVLLFLIVLGFIMNINET